MSNALLVIDQVHIRQDAEGRYCLNDLHKAAGGASNDAPAQWLRTAKADELVAELQKETMQNCMVSIEGRNGGTFVCKEMVYAYAMWISAAFQLKVIKAYDAMVTGQMDMQTQARMLDRKALALMIIEQEDIIEQQQQAIRARALRGVMVTPKNLVAEYCVRAGCTRVGGTRGAQYINMRLENAGLQVRGRNARGQNVYTPTEKGQMYAKAVSETGLHWDLAVVDLLLENDA